MKRPHARDARLWALVTATVRPFPGRTTPAVADGSATLVAQTTPSPPKTTAHSPKPGHGRAPLRQGPPQSIEPNRLRLIDRRQDPLPTIDLHGLDQARARSALTAFVQAAAAREERTVLVVTGKGALGDGVLRRRAPEWLAEPPLRDLVAGLAEAHRTRGGAGALYVALRRRPQAR